jgi:hypothetical protein
MSYFNAKLGSAWLQGSNNLKAPGREVALHQVGLSGLTNAIDSLEGDK